MPEGRFGFPYLGSSTRPVPGPSLGRAQVLVKTLRAGRAGAAPEIVRYSTLHVKSGLARRG